MIKLVLGFAGLVALGGLGAWVWFGGMLDPLLTEVGLSQQEAPTPTPQQQQPQSQSELATGKDTSDEALDEDLDTLDAQMSAYGEASAAVDESLTDQSVQQEY